MRMSGFCHSPLRLVKNLRSTWRSNAVVDYSGAIGVLRLGFSSARQRDSEWFSDTCYLVALTRTPV